MPFTPPPERDIDAWQIQVWNLPEDELSRPQKLQFMLMLENEFNGFDPYRVVGDLVRHRDLWRGAVMDRGFVMPDESNSKLPCLRTDLIKLRDIGDGRWNVDTLFLLTDEAYAAKLRRLAKRWSADEVSEIGEPEAGGLLGCWLTNSRYKIVTVWWD